MEVCMRDFTICSVRRLLAITRRVRRQMLRGVALGPAAAIELHHVNVCSLDYKFVIHVIGLLVSRSVKTRRQLALIDDDRLKYFR